MKFKNYLKIQFWKIQKVKILIFIIIATIIIINIVVGLYNLSLTSYHYHADWNRDYIVANHIVAHKEFPLTPPHTGELGTAIGSPVYFYLLAGFLFLKNDFLFLGLVNIFLQILSLIGVFIISRIAFGTLSAIIAFFIFGTNTKVLEHYYFVWQPYFMIPLLILSMLLLLIGFQKRSYAVMLAGVFLFILGGFVHVSLLALTPSIIIIVVIILRKINASSFQWAGLIFLVLISILVLRLPVLFTAQNLTILSQDITMNYIPSFSIFFNQFISRTDLFLKNFFEGIYAYILIISASALLFLTSKNKRAKQLIFLAFIILQFFVVIAFMPEQYPNPFPFRYFIPVIPIFIIFLAGIITIPTKRIIDKFLKIVFFIFLITSLFSQSVLLKEPNVFISFAKNYHKFFSFKVIYSAEALSLEKEINLIKNQEEYTHKDFFRIVGYRIFYADADTFYRELQGVLNIKLTKVDDDAERDYSPITKDDYIFIVCPAIKELPNIPDCLERLYSDYPFHTLLKEVIKTNSVKIYLTKRKDII